MANITEVEQWEETVYQIDEDDLVLGGPDGPVNLPIEQLANRTLFLRKGLDKLAKEHGAFGYTIPFRFMPSGLQLVAWRCLPLQGQVVLISQYQRLCDAMYVGDGNNAAADWWYKTSDEAGTVRDPSGAYMRIADGRGMFERGAGANSLYRMASDAPYDGGSIGSQHGDTIRNIYGTITTIDKAIVPYGSEFTGAFCLSDGNSHTPAPPEWNNLGWRLISFDASRVVPTSGENTPVWIAVYVCIRY